MKTNKLYRILALILALTMAFALALPSYAATDTETKTGNEPPYTVNIYPNEYTDTSKSDRFAAYQIFDGFLNEKSTEDGGYDGGSGTLKQPNVNQLADVTWGSSIKTENIGKLLYALTQDATVNAEGKLKAALEEAGYKLKEVEEGETADEYVGDEYVSLENSGEIVAIILAELNGKDENGKPNNNAALARAFADVVASKDGETYKYLTDPEKTSTWKEEGEYWEIKDLEGGYYLIADTYRSEDHSGDGKTDKANSDFLVGVFGDTSIYVKSDIPTVDKTIVGGSAEEGTSAEIGRRVRFQLKGTLPENYDDYDTYYYSFIDTLSAGLTYANNVKVTVKIDNAEHVITKQVTVGAPSEEKPNQVTFTIEDLKKITKADDAGEGDETTEGEAFTITAKAEIYVEYDVYLNENAVIDGPNTNTVELEYSNDPNSNEHGKTHKEIVYVYTFGIDLYKYDASTVTDENPQGNALAGAGFTLSKEEEEIVYYAIFDKTGDVYYAAGWISAENLLKYFNNGKTEEEKVDNLDKLTDEDWKTVATTGNGVAYAALTGADWNEGVTSGTFYLVLVTEDGGKLNIKGLKEDTTYVLSEAITPEGFDSLKGPITVTYKAEYYDIETIEAEIKAIEEVLEGVEEGADNKDELEAKLEELKAALETAKTGEGKLKTLIATVIGVDGKTESKTIVENGEYKDGYTSYAVDIDVANIPAGYLPGTGGMGTTLIYVAGILLLVCAGAYIFLSNRKSKNVQ